MSINPHIFIPMNNSFEARVKALKEVMSAYRNAKAGIEQVNSPQASQSLGTLEEVEYALNLASDSLDLAFNSFNEDELRKIEKDGLVEKSELAEVVQAKRKNEMNEVRNNQSEYQESNQHK